MSAIPTAGGDERDRVARRRAAIRRHHPDAGGTAEELVAALEALRTQRPSVIVVPTLRGRLRRVLRRRGRPRRTLH